MPFRMNSHARLAATALLIVAGTLVLVAAYAPRAATPSAHAQPVTAFCANHPTLCTETAEPWNYRGQYTGHDEPSLLFYSNTPGSGNNSFYKMTLPSDPPTLPAQDGSGGTWNFQLHPAFWFGMALCDDQSAPLPGKQCNPDSDSNIFTSTDPNSPKYIGKAPGVAFMEMQFYPPGWDSFGCTQTQWCSAMTIDSLSTNMNTGVLNTAACLNVTGEEYVNFAFVTKSGHSQGPADPLRQTAATFTPGPDTLMYNSGDRLTVDLHDTPVGFKIVIHDLTSGQSGSMTASVGNQFGHPKFQPTATHCNDQPYAFHPMYSTSSESTRVLWAAHSYNVAYSDEIGHFEYCAAQSGGVCTSAGASDPSGVDGDDAPCLTAPAGTPPNTVSLTGCSGTDVDFDGAQYANNWPGTDPNPVTDGALHATPVVFSSPLFNGTHNYSRVAFETDLPRIEFATNPPCQRHVSNPADPNPGAGCVNPPVGASFYPFFTTGTSGGNCVWQEGGDFIPGTTNDFGGSSAAEYGGLLLSAYPTTGNTVTLRYNNFHNTLSSNPCGWQRSDGAQQQVP